MRRTARRAFRIAFRPARRILRASRRPVRRDRRADRRLVRAERRLVRLACLFLRGMVFLLDDDGPDLPKLAASLNLGSRLAFYWLRRPSIARRETNETALVDFSPTGEPWPNLQGAVT